MKLAVADMQIAMTSHEHKHKPVAGEDIVCVCTCTCVHAGGWVAGWVCVIARTCMQRTTSCVISPGALDLLFDTWSLIGLDLHQVGQETPKIFLSLPPISQVMRLQTHAHLAFFF